MLQTIRVEKVDGAICLVSLFPFCVIVFRLSKKVHFLKFCAYFSKKPKSIKVIYTYASEGFSLGMMKIWHPWRLSNF